MASESRWTLAVRILALLSAILIVIAVLEGRTIRRLRAEVQQLRTERDESKAGVASAWTQQTVDDVAQALQWLDRFYAEPTEGFGRAGGLCPDARLDDRAIAAHVFGGFLPARAARKPMIAAIEAMEETIRRTDRYRAVHPDLALPAIKK